MATKRWLVGLCVLLASCTPPPARLITSAPSGTAIVQFNDPEPGNSTVILSNANGGQSGVSADALEVGNLTPAGPINQIALDLGGNVGVRGHVLSGLGTIQGGGAPSDPLAALGRAQVRIVTSKDAVGRPIEQINFVGAAPGYLTGPGQSATLDLTTSLAITIAAVNQLSAQVKELQVEVARLKQR